MDITDFNKGKKPINMNPQKSHNPPIFSPQPHSMKTTKSFTTQTQTQTTQIYSPQPFTPIYSPQPFAPYYPTTTTTTTKSTTFYSRPSSPLCSGSIPTSKKQYPQRSLNNSPLSIGSDNGSINISTNYPIHQSSSTSKLYLGNKKTHISNNVSNSMNMNNLYPPNFNNYGANINSGNGVKHQNKTVHKVYQHTRKVINDDNNESVEVSTEVTQQLYQIDGSLGHEHSSIYSFTSYTNNTNENNNNMKLKLDFIEIYKTLTINIDFSYLNEENNRTNDKFMHLIPAKDYKLFNLILDLYIDEFNELDKTEIINVLYKKYPDNIKLIKL